MDSVNSPKAIVTDSKRYTIIQVILIVITIYSYQISLILVTVLVIYYHHPFTLSL